MPARPRSPLRPQRFTLRAHLPALAFALLAAALVAWLGLTGFAFNDYDAEAAPAYKALADGHLLRFLALCPAYGGALLLRAPFALAPRLWGGGELAVYRMVALPCLLATVALAVWLVARMRTLGHNRLARGVALALCAGSPIALRALDLGHAEELLAAVLTVAALLAARSGRASWAGLALGLAVATKPWALVAVAPVLVTLPAARWRAIGLATVVAALLLAPPMIVQAGNGTPATGAALVTGKIFQPWQLWWWAGATGKIVRGGDGLIKVGYRAAPGWLSDVTHPLILFVSVPLALLWLRARRRSSSSSSRAPRAAGGATAAGDPAAGHRRAAGGATAVGDPLLLLALVLLLRSALDPWDNVYYLLPFLLALLCWETLVARQPPLWTLVGTVIVWCLFQALPGHITPDLQSVAYLACALPAALALGWHVYAPRRPLPWRAGSQSTLSSCLGRVLTLRWPSSVITTRSSMRTPS